MYISAKKRDRTVTDCTSFQGLWYSHGHKLSIHLTSHFAFLNCKWIENDFNCSIPYHLIDTLTNLNRFWRSMFGEIIHASYSGEYNWRFTFGWECTELEITSLYGGNVPLLSWRNHYSPTISLSTSTSTSLTLKSQWNPYSGYHR